MRVTLLLPAFAIHTLPPRSTAIPVGVANTDESMIPPDAEIGAPAFENRLTVLFPFVTHTWPFPSIAMPAGASSPPPELIVFCTVSTWLVSSSTGPAPTLQHIAAGAVARDEVDLEVVDQRMIPVRGVGAAVLLVGTREFVVVGARRLERGSNHAALLAHPFCLGDRADA